MLRNQRNCTGIPEVSMKVTFQRSLIRLSLIVVVLTYSIGSAQVSAQQTGTISGTVSDSSGNVLPNASVQILAGSRNVSRQSTSDAQGTFMVDGLTPGDYTVDVASDGFTDKKHSGLVVAAGQTVTVSIQLAVALVSQEVIVTAADSNSIAAIQSPVQAPLDAESARSEFGQKFLQEYTSPISDYGTVLQSAPGTFSISSNGIGLGQDKTYFRGFADGNYDITWDGIPFNDTNSPTHHSWAFFPAQWIGGIDFDRSPGSASTVGPTPFGGSINLLSREVPEQQSFRTSVAYGSFNTLLVDGQYDTGAIFGSTKDGLSLDTQYMTSDGFQTYNHQRRIGGDLKFQHKFSDKLILTAFSGWIMLDNNTPNTTTPTRTQVATLGYNFLLNNDPTSPFYYGYNGYNLPTNFSYIGLAAGLGHGWKLDAKPYTYSYKNRQWYYAAAPVPNASGLIDASCATPTKVGSLTILPCTADQLNDYHKYGEVATLSQTSRYGVFRAGMWYEWANTVRYSYPTNPFTGQFGSLPNYHEYFTTSSYQPFAEYSYQAIPKLTFTGGFKYADYTQNLTQYADNGKTIGTPPNGAASVYNTANYNSPLPDAAINYRIKANWSAYLQFAQGSVIPPSSVFDVKTGAVETLPKPARTTAYQGGTVVKLNRVMFDADVYRIKYQNAYSSFTPAGGEPIYYLNPDSVTIGAEMETNVAITHDLSVYSNGSIGQAQYSGSGVPSGLWVANTPAYTEGVDVTYQQRNLDLGVFQKLVGPMWSDNKTFHNQVPISPFQIVNLFLNYTVRNNSMFDQTKIGLSFNNLFNEEQTIGVTPANAAVPIVVNGVNSTYLANTTLAGGDLLSLLPGRSIMISVTFGLQSKR
jgi:iron complex outermembrane receptor protein